MRITLATINTDKNIEKTEFIHSELKIHIYATATCSIPEEYLLRNRKHMEDIIDMIERVYQDDDIKKGKYKPKGGVE